MHAGGWRGAVRPVIPLGRRHLASGRGAGGAGSPPGGGGPRGPAAAGGPEPDGAAPGARPSVSLWWRGLQVCAGVAVAAGLSAAALPAALSTQWGLQQAMELINLRMPGRVEVAEARLSWSGANELSCVKVYDSPRGGQILLHLNKVSTSASLWQLLTGSRGFNLIISKPWINAIYDTKLGDFKLITWAERVGLLNAPPPPPPPRPQPAAAAASKAPPPQPSHQNDPQAQAAPGGSQAAAKPGGAPPQAPPRPPGGLVEVLGRINSKMDLSADVRLGRLNLVVADAMLLVPEEVRQILGPSVHITGAIGEQCLKEWAEEVGEDVGWALGAASSPTSSRAAGGAAALGASVSLAGPEGVAVRPPADVLRRPRDYKPGVMQVNSAHLAGEMRLWDGPDHTLLHQPATARLDLTPALTRLGLAAANPLLDSVVTVQGGAGGGGGAGGRLSASFNPDGGRLPYQAATVEMAPVTLALGPASNLLQLLSDLGLRGLGRGGGASSSVSLSRMSVHFTRGGELRTERVDMRLGGTAAAAATAAASGAGGGGAGDQGASGTGGSGSHGPGAGSAPAPESGTDAAAASAAAASAASAAAAMPAEPAGSGGVRLAVWGRADLMTDTLDFTVGVAPGPLLAALGLPSGERPPATAAAPAANTTTGGSSSSSSSSSRDLTLLPEGFLLLVPVRGPASAPRYDVAGAAVRLGQLGARQKAAQWAARREEHEREGHERGGDGGGAVRRGLAAGLGALVGAVAPPQELVAAIDALLLEDIRRTPPPLPPVPPGRSVA
ncbi:hypothetical protein HXX76_001238 [Chlamydomonas incerta]|uniref:Uncharacterized protein n=1 Tax=Chlamydomonas incerta TaxID=51695 RepID=A0A836B1D2_CHLIN|nr:hypothetical protein HXX76_001238 [Chlamydomonas incerta]|eukprot:KAG2444488.1 hypothetical protein HXX76_001238 [Chlamydomonas incerta]